MRTQAIAMVVAAPLLALGIPQAAAYTTPYYDGGIARPILAGTAVRRPVAACRRSAPELRISRKSCRAPRGVGRPHRPHRPGQQRSREIEGNGWPLPGGGGGTRLEGESKGRRYTPPPGPYGRGVLRCTDASLCCPWR